MCLFCDTYFVFQTEPPPKPESLLEKISNPGKLTIYRMSMAEVQQTDLGQSLGTRPKLL